jgi:hypothetical protein
MVVRLVVWEGTMMFRQPFSRWKQAPSALEVSEARFKRFVKEMETYEKKLTFERTLDAFLDLYSDWKKSHGQEVKLRLVMLVFELHRLNPEFQFDLFFQDEPLGAQSAGTSATPPDTF